MTLYFVFLTPLHTEECYSHDALLTKVAWNASPADGDISQPRHNSGVKPRSHEEFEPIHNGWRFL